MHPNTKKINCFTSDLSGKVIFRHKIFFGVESEFALLWFRFGINIVQYLIRCYRYSVRILQICMDLEDTLNVLRQSKNTHQVWDRYQKNWTNCWKKNTVGERTYIPWQLGNLSGMWAIFEHSSRAWGDIYAVNT